MSRLTIESLHIYPVKSLAGISVRQARLTPEGLEHDRRLMLVTENNRFVTQRQVPTLALIGTALEDGHVVLSRAGYGEIAVALQDESGSAVETRVWNDECEALDCGDEVARWLTEASGATKNLRLVRMKPGFSRPQNRPERFGAGHTTVFADAAPLLVANTASLEALNGELLARDLDAVPMNRFRPNLVIRGLPAFAEHATATLQGEGCSIRLCDPCERCVVTTIDQATALRDPGRQPFATLVDINPMPDNPRAPSFGQNAVLQHGDGRWLRVGGTLTLQR